MWGCSVPTNLLCLCEERSDEAISGDKRDCFAALAMTALCLWFRRLGITNPLGAICGGVRVKHSREVKRIMVMNVGSVPTNLLCLCEEWRGEAVSGEKGDCFPPVCPPGAGLRSPSRKHWSKPMTALCLWLRRLGLQIPTERFVKM